MREGASLRQRSRSAAKWSFATEILVKLVSPISQMILARLLAPEAFGMVTTVHMVVSLADMFSDAGFQKYLVQHDFPTRSDLYRSANVAFWSNLTVSAALWGVIALNREAVAAFVGNPSLGVPMTVACASLPLTSFSSIQIAILHRDLDFKSLMPARLLSAVATFAITVTLALLGRGYWSLIWGTLGGNVMSAILLTALSPWKPGVFYSFDRLYRMLSFSGWTLLETFAIWLTTWSGSFVVGNILGSADLGLYRTPVTFVNGCFNIVTNATTPILFSSLSKLQFKREEFIDYLLKFQFVVGVFLLPLSAGIFVFRAPLVHYVLGDQWTRSTLMFGLFGLLQGPMILMSNYSSEAYRALGRPRVSLLVQCVYMCFMIPSLVVASHQGYDTVVVVDALCRTAFLALNQVLACYVVGYRLRRVGANLWQPLACSLGMGAFGYLVHELLGDGAPGVVASVLACATAYLLACLMVPRMRNVVLGLLRRSGRMPLGIGSSGAARGAVREGPPGWSPGP